jgi:sugar/nucleoside kinase (ribokinase family)
LCFDDFDSNTVAVGSAVVFHCFHCFFIALLHLYFFHFSIMAQTKSLHLCGIGAAIVDIQLQITEAEFDALGLTKGTMNLVDAARQRELLERFNHTTAYKHSGGSAANTVIAFGQFGGSAALNSMLGNDELGAFYVQEFRDMGIRLDVTEIAGESTGTSLIVITPDSERTLNTALAVNSLYAKEHVAESAIKDAEWLYFEGYKFTDEASAEGIELAMHYAKKYDTKIAVSFSDTFIVNVFGEHLRKAVSNADLVFCNESEAQAYTTKTDENEVFAALKAAAPNVAFTMGGRGSLVHWQGRDERIAPAHATPLDATGAGDMYAAGFLYGITHGHSAARAGALGSQAAAKVISQLGARLSNDLIADVKTLALS